MRSDTAAISFCATYEAPEEEADGIFWSWGFLLASIRPKLTRSMPKIRFYQLSVKSKESWPTSAHPPQWSRSCPGQWQRRPSWRHQQTCQPGRPWRRTPCAWKSRQLGEERQRKGDVRCWKHVQQKLSCVWWLTSFKELALCLALSPDFTF